MATIEIPNPPSNLTMQDFRSRGHSLGGLQKSCRFAVMIIPQGKMILNYLQFSKDLLYLCEVAELPGRSFMNLDVRYYGPNQKLPFQSQYEDINLTFLCRNKSLERQFFDNWQTTINPPNTWDFNYRDDYRAQIHIYQFDEYEARSRQVNTNGAIVGGERLNAPTAQYWMTIYNAYPILVNPQPVTWADDQFHRLIVSFTYTHWQRIGIDPFPRNAPDAYSFELVEGSKNIR